MFPSSPTSPWHVVIYFDAISPQNPLAKGKDKRKVQAVYWSFLQFGALLCEELLWFCCSSTRNAIVQDCEGGMSAHVRILLTTLFFGREFNSRRHGLTLDLSDAGDRSELVTLWADHGATVADLVALEEVLLNKGHSGSKPCAVCRLLVDHKRKVINLLTY